MSSMRNAVQRRNHKERAQPAERERWGLLEKHKDYSLRAKDYNLKKARLKALRSKAAERNPDEFHYGMLSSKSKAGRKTADRGNLVLSHDAVKMLKTQDSGYLRSMMQKTRAQIERLEGKFVLKDNENGTDAQTLWLEAAVASKILYVEVASSHQKLIDVDKSSDVENQSENMDEDEPQPQRISSGKKLEMEQQARKDEATWRRRRQKEQETRRAKLVALKDRERNLREAENELESQRARMNNVVGGVNKAGVKFKTRERKT